MEALQRSLEQALPAPTRTDLPAEVLALARRFEAFGCEGGRLVRLTQSGEMRLRPGAKPLAFTARQTIALTEVSFLWRALFRVSGLPMQVVDYLVDGQGGLRVQLLDLLPLVRKKGGSAMFRGEAMRYLAELMWAPDAMLVNPQLDWQVINEHTLAVATGEGARRCEIRLILDESGDPIRVEADDRPYMEGSSFTARQWFGRGGDYRMVNGRRIPTRGEVGWILDGVEFVYGRFRIESWLLEESAGALGPRHLTAQRRLRSLSSRINAR